MIKKELFEGPVGDYCIACNTIKCLFILLLTCLRLIQINRSTRTVFLKHFMNEIKKTLTLKLQ